jgi:hypothetical protein
MRLEEMLMLVPNQSGVCNIGALDEPLSHVSIPGAANIAYLSAEVIA